MSNTINPNFFQQYKTAGQIGKQKAAGLSNLQKGKDADNPKDPIEQFGGAASSVEISQDGMAALQVLQRKQEGGDGADGIKYTEDQLSDKAKDFLARLREKYGDYDFVVADNVENPLDVEGDNSKAYSVILSSKEIEKMAADEEYADKIMGDVESAIGTARKLSESGELGEGVEISRLAISVDDQGNMKLFAELDKMSAQQKERLEAAKEKKAEEAEKAEKQAEKQKAEEEKEPTPLQRVRIEAGSEEELMEKILGIKWDEIEAQ